MSYRLFTKESRAGHMYDMSGYYRNKPTSELKTLRSKKFLKIQKLESEPKFWFSERELQTQRSLLKMIDAELNSRADQLSFL